jgi:hypothetical protein
MGVLGLRLASRRGDVARRSDIPMTYPHATCWAPIPPRINIRMMAMVALLCPVFVGADDLTDFRDGLDSSDAVIVERHSVIASLFTTSLFQKFERVARKHDMQCRYDFEPGPLGGRPPYRSLICGPDSIHLMVLSPIKDGHLFWFRSDWFSQACDGKTRYTREQLKAMAETFTADYQSALVNNWRVKQLSFGKLPSADVDTGCPEFPDLVE